MSDAEDLRAGISDLAGLVAGSLGLPALLTAVADFAVHAIPGADGAGVTLLRVDRVDNMVEALAASAPFVAEIDEIQYTTVQEGPSITAASERRTVRSGSLGGEKTWPRFGPRVGRLGVHSALSLPLLVPDKVVGAINVYARDKDVFDEHAAELGELFAKPAAVAVHNAQILARRAVTDRPIGDGAGDATGDRSGDRPDPRAHRPQRRGGVHPSTRHKPSRTPQSGRRGPTNCRRSRAPRPRPTQTDRVGQEASDACVTWFNSRTVRGPARGCHVRPRQCRWFGRGGRGCDLFRGG